MERRTIFLIKVTALVLCAALLLPLFGCGESHEDEEGTKLYLFGRMSKMEKKTDVRSVVALISQGGERQLCTATIKVQGSSSLKYEKKNYTIKLFEDLAHEKKHKVDMGWGAENEYCLKANWIDKTHCRNVVTAKLAAEVQSRYGLLEQAPCNGLIDGFPVEVFINGRFHGIYTWNIPKAEWMFGMDDENPDHIVMCGENWEDPAVFYAEPDLESWAVEVGPEDEEALARFKRLTDFIMYSSDEEFKEQFDEYLNKDALLNYYVISEFAHLPDNFGKNMLIATYDGKLWYPSLYDLDTSWGSRWNGEKLYDYIGEPAVFSSRNNLARRFEAAFPQELHDRYFELRQDLLTKEHVMELFTDFDERIPEEWKQREIKRWGEDIPGFDLSQIEEYLDSNIERVDARYEALIQ